MYVCEIVNRCGVKCDICAAHGVWLPPTCFPGAEGWLEH
jgi:hypothetical protein